jgi:hypothetical protein
MTEALAHDLGKENHSISFFVMNKSIEDDNLFFYLEQQDEMTDMNSLVITHTTPEIFEMVDSSFVTIGNLVDLFLNSFEQNNITLLEFCHHLLEFVRDADLHNSSHQLLNSSEVIGFLLPDLSSSNTSSVDLTASLARDALTSLSSSSAISDISATFLSNSSSSMSPNRSDMAFVATEDQSIHDILDILSFNSLGTLTTTSAISITSNNNYPQEYKNFFRKNDVPQKEKNVVQVHEGAEIGKKREEKVLLVKLFF